MELSTIKLNGGPLDGQLQADPSTNQFEVVCREPVTFFETPIATVKPGIKVAGFYVRSRFDHSRFDWRPATS
jgi:hypothetical protein